MQIKFLKSFDKSYRKLHPDKQDQTDKTVEKIVNYLNEKTSKAPKGLGLERRRGAYWYGRVDISIRILFKREKETLMFYFVGNHNQIDKYIKTMK